MAGISFELLHMSMRKIEKNIEHSFSELCLTFHV